MTDASSSDAVPLLRNKLEGSSLSSSLSSSSFAGADVQRQPKQQPQQKQKKKRNSSSSSKRGKRGGGRGMTLITLLIVVLLIGCVQIVYFHSFGIDVLHQNQANGNGVHWFDHSPWKIGEFHLLNASSTSTSTTSAITGGAQQQILAVHAKDGDDQQQQQQQQKGGDNKEQDSDKKTMTDKDNTKKEPPPILTTSTAVKSKANSTTNNHILAALKEAGLDTDLQENETLPSWKDLTDLYGPLKEPVVVGMDSCEQYRQSVPSNRRYTSVAGMFNTGTNAMTFHLRKNLNLKSIWQVPWGKHRMEFVRLNHTAGGAEEHEKLDIMPVILVRDPYHWMQSMCKSPYAAHWRGRKDHCPNLVPDELDREHFHMDDPNATMKVRVKFDEDQEFHWPSLVHLWNDYYRRYLEVTTYPRLIFRFEDMLVHGPTVMKMIANCTGSTVPDVFEFQTKSAKGHGSHTGFLKALMKTGDPGARIKQMTKDDIRFANQHLDEELLRVFRYTLPAVD